ncbi:60S acidic ribosomal protein P1-like [Orycteropus afer afer]|uniref:60S acidic ribosomal protein P1-like n=1 Tax=Orycteropus afer afer TaxID=1230840 RepID=A0AC54Z7C5_ORYAF|nr:60S acidic ribosomal protein P1-like [Orycteropus afer afer]
MAHRPDFALHPAAASPTLLHHGLRYELAYSYLALTAHDDEVTITEDEINALMEAVGANVEPFWPGLFAKALANINIGSLICRVGAGGPAPAAAEKVEAKKEESDDDTGFGLFD